MATAMRAGTMRWSMGDRASNTECRSRGHRAAHRLRRVHGRGPGRTATRSNSGGRRRRWRRCEVQTVEASPPRRRGGREPHRRASVEHGHGPQHLAVQRRGHLRSGGVLAGHSASTWIIAASAMRRASGNAVCARGGTSTMRDRAASAPAWIEHGERDAGRACRPSPRGEAAAERLRRSASGEQQHDVEVDVEDRPQRGHAEDRAAAIHGSGAAPRPSPGPRPRRCRRAPGSPWFRPSVRARAPRASRWSPIVFQARRPRPAAPTPPP